MLVVVRLQDLTRGVGMGLGRVCVFVDDIFFFEVGGCVLYGMEHCERRFFGVWVLFWFLRGR